MQKAKAKMYKEKKNEDLEWNDWNLIPKMNETLKINI